MRRGSPSFQLPLRGRVYVVSELLGGGGAGGDFELVLQFSFSDEGLHDKLGHGAAADVAVADEEDPVDHVRLWAYGYRKPHRPWKRIRLNGCGPIPVQVIPMDVEIASFSADAKDDLIRICNDVDRTWLSDRMPEPYTEKDADEWIAYTGSREGSEGFYRIIRVDSKAVGEVSAEKDPETREWTVGYFVSKGYCNQGIATEALGKMCSLVFEETDADGIRAKVFAPNATSVRVLEKNGFVQEGMKAGLAPKGRVVCCEYLYVKHNAVNL